jgi:hypothetical protein
MDVNVINVSNRVSGFKWTLNSHRSLARSCVIATPRTRSKEKVNTAMWSQSQGIVCHTARKVEGGDDKSYKPHDAEG